MIYCYWISRGLASLHKVNSNGDDYDKAPKKIGKFSDDKQAKDACLQHYEKACKMAIAANREKPAIMWM